MTTYEKYGDLIWCLLCVTTISIGLFVDTAYGLYVIILIGVHFYIQMQSLIYYDMFEKIVASIVTSLIHIAIYLAIIILSSFIINTKDEIINKQSLEVKLIEYGKIVVSKNNTIEIIDDEKIYWECRHKNCKYIIESTYIKVPENSIFSKNLMNKQYIKYSVSIN